ncbi:MAG: hypothetical protein IJ327_03550 [Lachnospiraceae bacterium]|nr:hypothetical protein [Lachnospiraceae bacterium]
MLNQLFTFIHETLGMCFWTPFALLVGVLMVVIALMHSRNQKKREKVFLQETQATDAE